MNIKIVLLSFVVNLDRSHRSCNTLDDPSGKIYFPNKTVNVNTNIFNMITRINESKTSPKHISCKCKCKFDGRKCNSDQKWKNDNV